MLNYSDNARKILSVFYRFRNDIDIYTEDNISDKEFYRVFFKRIINDDAIKINDVIPLGSKTVVLSKYDEYIQSKSKRKSLFLVDGDLDLIIESNPPDSAHLFVHKVYCVENYLIDKHAILELAYYNHGEKSKAELEVEVNFETWVDSISKNLCDLFIVFAILKKLGGGPVIKNAYSFYNTSGKKGDFDVQLITDYITELKNAALLILQKNGKDAEKEYENLYSSLIKKWGNSNFSALKIVSGKDYLLQLLQFHLSLICKKGGCIPTKNIKLFLVNHCDFTALKSLKSLLVA